MGAWGHQVFENDDALDWVGQLEEAEDTSAIVEAFEAIPTDPEEYVEAPEASMALAAAEVVAALLGRPAASLPEAVGAWVAGRKTVKPGLVKKARRAVDRILANSELKDLWGEAEDESPEWGATVVDLLKRLSSSVP